MTELLAGLSLGLAAGLSPGPLQALVVTASLQRGFPAGWRVAVAPLLTDAPVIALSVAVLSRLPDGFVTGLGIAGGVAVLVVAARSLREAGDGPDPRPVSGDLWRGVAVNLLSPHPWIFWAAVGGPLLLGAWRRSSLLAVAFLGGFYLLLVGSKVALAWGVARGGRRLGARARRRLVVAGAFLMAVAGGLLVWEAATGRLEGDGSAAAAGAAAAVVPILPAAASRKGSLMRLGVLVSGSGSNLQALLDAMAADPEFGAEVAVVVSDRAGAGALDRAARAGVPAEVVAWEDHADRAEFTTAVCDAAARHGAEALVLAGFMRILSPEAMRRFPDKILNVHPALLPAFPGAHAVAAALEHGVKVTGATVHLVDEDVDHGPIVSQAAVPVRADDTVASLHRRIQAEEHVLLPEAVRALARGELVVDGRMVRRGSPAGSRP